MAKKNYTLQKNPFVVPTDDGKYIGEHFGKASDGNSELSIAHMIAPPNWSEPFQTPEFDEYTFIFSGQKQFIIDKPKESNLIIVFIHVVESKLFSLNKTAAL